MGADHVLALDIDPLAVKVAKQNIELNRVSNSVTVLEGTIARGSDGLLFAPRATSGHPKTKMPQDKYDLTLANIIAEILITLVPALALSISETGLLVTSGIILEKEELVRNSLSDAKLEVVERFVEKDWVALIARRTV